MRDQILAFVVGVLSSLVATFFGSWFAFTRSSKMRWFITGILARIAHHDIEFVYNVKADSKRDLEKDLENSKKIYIISSRGDELKRKKFQTLLKNKDVKRKIDIRIILPQILEKQGEFDFTAQREEEIKQFDEAYSVKGSLKKDVQRNVEYIRNYISDQDNLNVQLALVNFPHLAKIILTDDYLYLQPYNENRHGDRDPVLKFTKGETYYCFNRYFDLLWKSVEQYEKRN